MKDTQKSLALTELTAADEAKDRRAREESGELSTTLYEWRNGS